MIAISTVLLLHLLDLIKLLIFNFVGWKKTWRTFFEQSKEPQFYISHNTGVIPVIREEFQESGWNSISTVVVAQTLYILW